VQKLKSFWKNNIRYMSWVRY